MKTTLKQVKDIIKEELGSMSQAPKKQLAKGPKWALHPVAMDLNKASDIIADACTGDPGADEQLDDVRKIIDGVLGGPPNSASYELPGIVSDAAMAYSYAEEGEDRAATREFDALQAKALKTLERLWKKAGLPI